MNFLKLCLGVLLGVLCQTVLLCLLQLVYGIAACVADGNLGSLVLLAALLDKILAALLGEWRNGQADNLAVVGRHDTYR